MANIFKNHYTRKVVGPLKIEGFCSLAQLLTSVWDLQGDQIVLKPWIISAVREPFSFPLDALTLQQQRRLDRKLAQGEDPEEVLIENDTNADLEDIYAYLSQSSQARKEEEERENMRRRRTEVLGYSFARYLHESMRLTLRLEQILARQADEILAFLLENDPNLSKETVQKLRKLLILGLDPAAALQTLGISPMQYKAMQQTVSASWSFVGRGAGAQYQAQYVRSLAAALCLAKVSPVQASSIVASMTPGLNARYRDMLNCEQEAQMAIRQVPVAMGPTPRMTTALPMKPLGPLGY